MRDGNSTASEPAFLSEDYLTKAFGRSRKEESGDRSFEQYLVSLGLLRPEQIGPLVRTARQHRVPSLQLIRAEGLANDDELYGAVAAFHDLPYLAHAYRDLTPAISAHEAVQCLRENWIILETKDGKRLVAAAPQSANTTTLRNLGGTHGLTDPFDAITTPAAIRSWIRAVYGDVLLEQAVAGIAAVDPQLSAQRRFSVRQLAVVLGLVLLLGVLAVIAPPVSTGLLYFAGVVAFISITLLRVTLLIAALPLWRRQERPVGKREEHELPEYTILVPLYRDGHMAPKITEALWKLDYPRAKLDIKIIVEHDDDDTRTALDRLQLPQCFDVLTVPPAVPRTKPKALNYALAFSSGEFVAVYDAENVPEPDQLRKVVEAFDRGGTDLACVQTTLTVDNASRGWLARQSAIEYAIGFEVVLPAQKSLDMAPALGGSAHHFRMSALREAGGWDSFNVNEAADVGMRFGRFRYHSTIIGSKTLESVPVRLGNWFGQRIRLMRGLLQTSFVHLREPIGLWRDMGMLRFLGSQAMLTGRFAAALVYPFLVAHVIFAALVSVGLVAGGPEFLMRYAVVSAISLLIGYGAILELGVFGLYRSRRPDCLPHLALVPVYWMLISLAAYVALWRFMLRPFVWEKTRHGVEETGSAGS